MNSDEQATPRLFMIRAAGGRYANDFRRGGYVAIGWREISVDLGEVFRQGKDALIQAYKRFYADHSPYKRGNNIGQIWWFLNDVRVGTYVLTSDEDSKLWIGRVTGDYYYMDESLNDIPYRHRKQVDWFSKPLDRSELSGSAQNSLFNQRTIFPIREYDIEFLRLYGLELPPLYEAKLSEEARILKQIMRLQNDELEQLIAELFKAMGFDTDVIGRSGDEGIDVIATMFGDEKTHGIYVVIQVKHYTGKVDHHDIRKFRSSVPLNSQAIFITTSDFTDIAKMVAKDGNFKHIGLVNGKQLTDLLIKHFSSLSPEMSGKLNLEQTLIPRADR